MRNVKLTGLQLLDDFAARSLRPIRVPRNCEFKGVSEFKGLRAISRICKLKKKKKPVN